MTEQDKITRMITIKRSDVVAEREPLVHPFGFKGGSLSELWQSVVRLESDRGAAGTGLGTQSVLWSDPRIFSACGEGEGNRLMMAITAKALELIKGQSFTTPVSLLEAIFDEVYDFGKKVTGRPDLYKTFVLNALVAADNAAWLVYAREKGIRDFDDLIPSAYRPAFSHRHDRVLSVPVIAYGTSPAEAGALAAAGCPLIKIKIGHPGTRQEMLEKDMAFMSMLHKALNGASPGGAAPAPGKIRYYLDANGRYESKELLRRFLDHLHRIGALEQIAILEEPFPPGDETDVSDLEVRIAADESAHTDADALARIQMGYGAIALKAVAKTLSMTLKIGAVAHQYSVPCFCADLTANPVLLEWNKNIAARIAPFPGLRAGLLETNGKQHYRNWDRLLSYSPFNGASWLTSGNGAFALNDEYYRLSGGIFESSPHYDELFDEKSR